MTLTKISSLLRSAALTVVASPLLFALPATAQVCQDGLDCRCDRLVDQYGDSIVFCEDFENPRLAEDGVWQTNSMSLQGAGWENQGYAGINLWCQGQTGVPQFGQAITNVVNNNGCIYLLERGDASTQPGAGPSETAIPLNDQTFDGNVSLMQTVRPQDGTMITANDGQVYPLNQPGGFHGQARLSRVVTSFGITSARYIATSVPNQGPAWKGNQYTPARAALTGTFNTTHCTDGQSIYPTGLGSNLEPYSGTLWTFNGIPTFTNTVGASCTFGNSSAPKLKSRPDNRSTPLFPRGEWVCQQVQYENWGASNGRIRHWVDGELVIDVALDMSDPSTSWLDSEGPGLGEFYWNNYYNGASWEEGGASNWAGIISTKNDGPKTKKWSGRLQDNLVIREGSPVSCSEIGFDFEGNPPGGGGSQNQTAPLPPILLMPE
ncbi:MAG: hypothetical protein MK108_19360 [Mariniblastus sp.]|nr:hypothetical protein [Mariniblastus sp.]